MAAAPPTPTRIVGYVRVSTDKQAEEGVSLEAQEAKLRAYAVAMDLELVAVERDAGISAKTLERPGLSRALAMLESGAADGLLITKLDRLTRSVRDLGLLLERHFTSRSSLLSLGDSIDTRSAGGRLVLHVLCSVAQWEREAIGERTKEAMAQLKANGVVLGPPPLEATEEGARTHARIWALRSEGLALRSICARLTAEGHATKRGGKWSAESVRLALLRPVALPSGQAYVAKI